VIGPALHGPCRVCEAQGGLGRHQTSTSSIKQDQTQLGFQFRDVSAHGRLAALQLARRTEKTSLVQYGKEGAHERPVERDIHYCNSEVHA
jgi:hypothetical protein